MNVLMVTNGFIYGGAQRYVTLLANALAEEGNKVLVISSGGPSVKRLHKRAIHKVVDSIPKTSKSGIMETAKVIEDICLKEKIDLTHCSSLTGLEATSLTQSRIAVPIIFTAHSVTMFGSPIVGSEIDKKVNKVIAVSNFITNHLRKTGLPSRKINLVYHGVDTNKFRERKLEPNIKSSLGIKDSERVVMCVARLEPVKGINHLVEAIPMVLERRDNIKVLFVGDGSQKENYERLARSLGVENKVLFLGAKENVEEFLSIADVFCLPSIREALSYAILEAMAEGRPVVATRVGGISEAVVDKFTGLLVPPGNIRELASTINRLLEDRELAKELGINAKSRVKEYFKFERMIRETVAVYKEVLEGEKVYA